MNKIIKITLAAIAMFAISFTISCSFNGDDSKDKWCAIEVKSGSSSIISCFKISSKATIYKNELLCLATENAKVVTSKSSCNTVTD